MNRKRGTLASLVLLGAAALTATGALARGSSDSVHVRYVAADLTRPEATQALYRRIRLAAKQVCHEPDTRELGRYREYQECFDRAVESAVVTVDASTLTALHRSRSRSAAG